MMICIKIKLVTLVFITLIIQPLKAEITKNPRWKILNPTWERSHELNYQRFVNTLGHARKSGACKTLDQCLRSPKANPAYYKMNPSNLKNIFADCADLPYVLRAYFSWMNDLPFGYHSDLVEASSFSRKTIDIRYSKYGNIVVAKTYVRNGQNINNVLQSISDTISTASFRTNASKNDSGNLFRDTYPVDVDRDAIVPGTILYDPNGHVAVVYDVTTNGKILMIDAHPDNSLSFITYGKKFARTGAKVAGGFSNFRPYSLVNNKITPKRNDELSGYSLIQFQNGPFIFKGKEYTFHEYVRLRLAEGEVVYNPLLEFKDSMNEFCSDIKYREEAVNASIKAGLQNQAHPEYLPLNIYGADGDWEAYASPSRDARLKTSAQEMRDYLKKVIAAQLIKDPHIEYSGTDLIKDLRDIYQSISKECSVKPTALTRIDLDFIWRHLFELSFDPYHCAELRWGGSCETSANKLSWYKAEQGLRNRMDRDNTIKTNYNVKSLPNAPVSKVEKPDLSIDKILEIER